MENKPTKGRGRGFFIECLEERGAEKSLGFNELLYGGRKKHLDNSGDSSKDVSTEKSVKIKKRKSVASKDSGMKDNWIKVLKRDCDEEIFISEDSSSPSGSKDTTLLKWDSTASNEDDNDLAKFDCVGVLDPNREKICFGFTGPRPSPSTRQNKKEELKPPKIEPKEMVFDKADFKKPLPNYMLNWKGNSSGSSNRSSVSLSSISSSSFENRNQELPNEVKQPGSSTKWNSVSSSSALPGSCENKDQKLPTEVKQPGSAGNAESPVFHNSVPPPLYATNATANWLVTQSCPPFLLPSVQTNPPIMLPTCNLTQTQNAIPYSMFQNSFWSTPPPDYHAQNERPLLSGYNTPVRMSERRSCGGPRELWKPASSDRSPMIPNSALMTPRRTPIRSQSTSPWRRLTPYNVELLMTENFEVGLIDTHCHLDFLFKRLPFTGSYSLFRDLNEKTYPVCYEGCIAIFCDPHTFTKEGLWSPLLNEDGVWGAFGVHPKMSRSYDSYTEDALKKALKHPKVRALGEIGLDYSRPDSDKLDQKSAFTRQLGIAIELSLPLVIHCRDAIDDCLEILAEHVPNEHFIHLHCFTADWSEASSWLETFPNLFLGMTCLVTYPTAQSLHEVARRIPLNRLLLETDAPYFYPRMLNSGEDDKRLAHPGMVLHVAAQIAALRECPIREVLNAVRQNTKKMYNI